MAESASLTWTGIQRSKRHLGLGTGESYWAECLALLHPNIGAYSVDWHVCSGQCASEM